VEKEFDFEGNVPGTVQGDLVNLNLMPHPYVGTNEKLFRRLEEKSWIYERTFYIDKLDPKSHYDLVLEGVDTLSQVYVNGEFAGKTENMFIEYRFSIKEYLREGENFLKIKIESPIEIPKNFRKKLWETAYHRRNSSSVYKESSIFLRMGLGSKNCHERYIQERLPGVLS